MILLLAAISIGFGMAWFPYSLKHRPYGLTRAVGELFIALQILRFCVRIMQ